MTNLQIKYLANCGLLVKSGKSSVLIDALNNDNSLFDMIDRETERAMIEGTGEWSDITAIAYTHRHVPGLKMVFPSNAQDAYGLMLSAVADDNPVVYEEHKAMLAMESEVDLDEGPIPLGVGKVVRPGSDVTIVAVGNMRHHLKTRPERPLITALR